jgi:hypothetical protein
VAEVLKATLPEILNGIECFVSSRDISKGDRPLNVIADNLDQADFGLIVVTPENVESSWINFEAGALGKGLNGRVAPVLVGLRKADVAGPLAQFQMTELEDKEDVWKLVSDMSQRLALPVPDRPRRTLFEAAWPTVLAVLDNPGETTAPTRRTSDDRIDELLLLVRRLSSAGTDDETFVEIRSAIEELIVVDFTLRFVEVFGGLVLEIRVADEGRRAGEVLSIEALGRLATVWNWTFYVVSDTASWEPINIYEQ